MSDINNLPAKLNLQPEQITKEMVRAYLNTQISPVEYQRILQGIAAIKPDKQNLVASYEKMKEVDKAIKAYQKRVKDGGINYWNAHKTINETGSEFLQPILEAFESLKQAIKKVDDENAADLKRANDEKERVNAIKASITEFVSNCAATIPKLSLQGIVNLQKRIGTELSKKTFYAEFKDDLEKQCDLLTPLVNQRKEAIKKVDELKKQQEQAEKSNDLEKLNEISEKLTTIDADLEENALRLQQQAFDATLNNDIVVGEPDLGTAKGRHYWVWEVTDIQKLLKKHPELVSIQANKEAIDALLSEKRKAGELDSTDTIEMPGLTFKREKRL